MPSITISVINFRTADLTITCAKSVLAQISDGMAAELVIVDNMSEDGSVQAIRAWIETLPDGAPVRLVASRTNSGFSGGHNQGMAAAPADYYLILNSDAVLRPGFLDRILEEATQHPTAGFIAPRLEYEDGDIQISCFRFPSPLSEAIRGANTGLFTRLLNHANMPLGTDPDPSLIDWASFACILLNGSMVSEIGPMDEGYFMYFEDAEYCLRARRAGWQVHYCPEAAAVHYRGGSGPVKSLAKARKRLPRYYYSSRTRFMYQAYGMTGLWFANVLWVIGRGFAQLRHVAGRRGNNFRQGELRDIWTSVHRPLGPRFAPRD